MLRTAEPPLDHFGPECKAFLFLLLCAALYRLGSLKLTSHGKRSVCESSGHLQIEELLSVRKSVKYRVDSFSLIPVFLVCWIEYGMEVYYKTKYICMEKNIQYNQNVTM